MTAEALVKQAVGRLVEEYRWLTQEELRALDEFGAINAAPAEVRRECALRLAAIAASELQPDRMYAQRLLALAVRRRLPFTEDDVAFLLADDTAIDDPTILAQIND